ncbi:hypothetical protein KP509_11G008700 [Ceratopteris richardii]|uniref:Uncharacterized protein n=1 Tax=Ceratopteris richardii TaxID=49495 RepID=A0A8T2TRQ9_CERRI|nr:hypothetical protein KP509_11G008700 [Ceratopteris richardii]
MEATSTVLIQIHHDFSQWALHVVFGSDPLCVSFADDSLFLMQSSS